MLFFRPLASSSAVPGVPTLPDGRKHEIRNTKSECLEFPPFEFLVCFELRASDFKFVRGAEIIPAEPDPANTGERE
jgi:hypothetical protein